MVKRAAVAALPIVLGAAIDITGLGGPQATVVAWLVVFVVLACLAASWLVGRRRLSWAGRAQAWHELGSELIGFSGKRRSELAQLLRDEQRVGVGWLFRRSRKAEVERVHDADTMAIYLQKFAERVRQVIGELQEVGLVGHSEGAHLASPTTPAAIERLGRRLLSLN
jgi:hypothetical protein